MSLIKVPSKLYTVALDGTGGDRNRLAGIPRAVGFALTMYPDMKLLVFGSQELASDLKKADLDHSRLECRIAPQSIPQDENPRRVLENYPHAAMRQAVEAVKSGEAAAVVSAGGTGPLVALSRHLLGTIGSLHPALCARIPAGKDRYGLMLDLGANAQSSAKDLYDFARLGTAAARVLLQNSQPRTAILNIGSERGKGSELVQNAFDLISSDPRLYTEGFVEANRLFCGEADIIVTDGFSGNIALKAAEGVARIFTHGPMLKRMFAKMAWPDWLTPWQYNGSLLLGVNGIVVKSHANALQEALAVAMVEAARAAKSGLYEAMVNDELLGSER